MDYFNENVEQTAVVQDSIYGTHRPEMEAVMQTVLGQINELRQNMLEETGNDPVEHALGRIKSEESMREKCRRRELPETTESALEKLYDGIGIRVVCAFVSDVYMVRDYLVNLPGMALVEEKDYIRHAKPNGYRSLHMILRYEDSYYLEIQLRTISMDTWAALEHQMKYKHTIAKNQGLIESELKRCADELAATDMSMQTLRDMIQGKE